MSMNINNKNQYNQGVGKYKVLSSTAGVGSVIPTKWGGFIMPLSSTQWKAINEFKNKYNAHPNDGLDRNAEDAKCELVLDDRFIQYLKSTEHLSSLVALIKVPHINLDDYNYCDYANHPIFKQWAMSNPKMSNERERDWVRRFIDNNDTITIPAIVFPRWFKSSLGSTDLKPIEEWEQEWNNLTHQPHNFVIPCQCKLENGHPVQRTIHQRDGQTYDVFVQIPLEQVQMVLICPNGHISDMPWDKYFGFKIDNQNRPLSGDAYRDLFNYTPRPCTATNAKHHLQWLPNRNNPESYGTLKCKDCGQSVSLEGIMNIRPKCIGEKPWVGNGVHETCDETMRWALVTSNSIYYADCFSSLYIPQELLEEGEPLDVRLSGYLEELSNKKTNWDDAPAGDFFNDYLFPTVVDDVIDDINADEDPEDQINETLAEICVRVKEALQGAGENALTKPQKKVFRRLNRKAACVVANDIIKILCIMNLDDGITVDDAQRILEKFNAQPQGELTEEKYRYDEYSVFMKKDKHNDSKHLVFNDIDLEKMESSISNYFSKIKQIPILAISTTQLNFSRAEMPQPTNDGGNIKWPEKQKIFDCAKDEVVALPANQNFGEGLFFSFNEEKIEEFCNSEFTRNRYSNLVAGDMGQSIKARMDAYGAAKFYLLHTFSHILMKELEFSCGYPTASLQERLYYSDRMCGVLIYTADGSEGSMGGLVWQGQPKIIEKIIRKALDRAIYCSSDPLCWEHRDQLNLAACFSCAMVSETSCEHFNLGLDRQALVSAEGGFFNDVLYHN